VAISRREFMTGLAGAGLGFGLGAVSHQFPLAPPQVGPEWQPGVETFVPSTCTLCPAHCGIRARLIDGKLTRIDGNPLHPVSKGGLCAKGRAGLQLYYHPGRLTGPLQRVGALGSHRFEAISWDGALDRVVQALASARENGDAGKVEWLAGHVPGTMGGLIAGFCRAYGTERISVDDYRDGSAEVMRLCQGIDTPPAFDLAASDLVLSFGAGLSEAWWALPEAAQARGDDGPRWVQVDTRLSRSAASADEWVAVKPGTYGTLALGLAYFILKEGQYDADMVSRRVSGWEDWKDDDGKEHLGFRRLVLRHGRPDYVSARTGIPRARLVALAKTFGRARSPVALWDQTVAWRSGGLADALAIHALNILKGTLNRPGGVLVQAPMPGDAEPGLSDVPLASTRWPAGVPADDAPSPVLFLYQANPLASAPWDERQRKAVSDSSLVVSFSPFLDETARHADLILPDHTYLERWQDAPAPPAVSFPVWGVVQPVAKPLHDTRATGDVLLDLASRLGGEVKAWARWTSVEQVIRERGTALAAVRRGSAFTPAFRRNELRELEGRGWWLSHAQSESDYWKQIRDTGGWFDPFYDYHDRSAMSQFPDGRVWIFPSEARRRLRDSNLGLAEGFLPATGEASGSELAVPGYPLRLMPYRVLTLASGGTVLMPWLLERLGVMTGNAWELWAEVNPETARELGVRSGQRVRIESARGEFEATVREFPGAQPGVINVPYGLHSSVKGWGGPSGANPLAAVGAQSDPVTGLPDWYSTQVRLIPV